MDNTTCPKCGAPVACRHVNGYEVIYQCDAAVRHGGFFVDSYRCLRDALANMTARAEKAEHDAKQCRFAVALAQEVIAKAEARAEKAEALAQYRLEAIQERDGFARYLGYPATCTYCGSRDLSHHTDCPTVTHPAEGPNE